MKRVYMISSQLMFSAGIKTMLSERSGIEVVGRETDPARVLEQIRELRPDVVILDSKDLASIPGSIVSDILREAPEAKVISLNLENDRMRIYQGELRSAQDLDDLVRVIEGQELELTPISASEWSALAAARFQVYTFLAYIYYGEVDVLLFENLPANFLKISASLGHGEDLTGDLQHGILALERFQQEISGLPLAKVKSQLRGEHARLLLGGKPGEWSIQACEAAYAGLEEPCMEDEITGVLNKIYTQGGLQAAGSRLTRPDFIGSELEFMRHLCFCENSVWTKKDLRLALIIQSLECAFLHEHLVRWAPRFCDFLILQTEHNFFRGIAWLTKGFILNEAYRMAELMEGARLTNIEWKELTQE